MLIKEALIRRLRKHTTEIVSRFFFPFSLSLSIMRTIHLYIIIKQVISQGTRDKFEQEIKYVITCRYNAVKIKG